MTAKLNIQEREADKNPRQIRSMGFIPATIYGKGMDSKNIQVNTHEFEMAYRNNKEGNWELTLGKEKFTAQIQELQANFATSEYLNIEFKAI
ncbi:hypothetical protein IJ531_01760 [bacterium]|nr:hypothetical protein [bacterium]